MVVYGMCVADTDWEVVRFDLEAVRAPGDGAVRALGRQKVPWLRQMGASRCTLSYVPQSGWNTPGYLWVGASVPGIKTGGGTPGTAGGSSGGGAQHSGSSHAERCRVMARVVRQLHSRQ